MRQVILTCDRCKKVVDKLEEVGAGKRSVSSSYHGGGTTCNVYQLWAEWCIDCCVEMHIIEPNKNSEAKPVQPPPTLEDIVREIVREEIQNT